MVNGYAEQVQSLYSFYWTESLSKWFSPSRLLMLGGKSGMWRRYDAGYGWESVYISVRQPHTLPSSIPIPLFLPSLRLHLLVQLVFSPHNRFQIPVPTWLMALYLDACSGWGENRLGVGFAFKASIAAHSNMYRKWRRHTGIRYGCAT